MTLRTTTLLVLCGAASIAQWREDPATGDTFVPHPGDSEYTDPTTGEYTPNPRIQRVTGNQHMRDVNTSLTDDGIRAMAISENNKFLFTGGGVSGKVNVWDISYLTMGPDASQTITTTTTSTTTLAIDRTLRAELKHISSLAAAGYKKPGELAATPFNVKLIGTFEMGENARVNAMVLDPNATHRILYVGSSDGAIKAFDSADIRMQNDDYSMFIQSGASVNALALSADGKTLYGGGTIGPASTAADVAAETLKIAHSSTKGKAASIGNDVDSAATGSFLSLAQKDGLKFGDGDQSADPQSDYSDDNHGFVRSWDVATMNRKQAPATVLDVHQGNSVFCLALHKDQLFAGGDNKMVVEWGSDGKMIREWPQDATVKSLAVDDQSGISTGDVFVISGGESGNIKVWNLSTSPDAEPEEALQEQIPHGAVVSEIVLRNGEMFTAGWAGSSEDPEVKRDFGVAPAQPTAVGIVRAFDLLTFETGQRKQKYSFPDNTWINALTISHSEEKAIMFTGGNEGTIGAYNMSQYDAAAAARIAEMRGGGDQLWEQVTTPQPEVVEMAEEQTAQPTTPAPEMPKEASAPAAEGEQDEDSPSEEVEKKAETTESGTTEGLMQVHVTADATLSKH